MFKRCVWIGLTVAILVVAGLGVWAPQVLVLAREGFPAQSWPTSGDFAKVQGVTARQDAPQTPLPKPALDRLVASQGFALLVDRGGSLWAEGYANGQARDDRLNSYSMVKSLIAGLTLRAIADDKIAGFEARLPDLIGPQAPDISIKEALHMISGLRLFGEPPKEDVAKSLDDAAFSPFAPVARMHAFGIENLMSSITIAPQDRGQFHYQSANTALLGLAVERAYDRSLESLLSDMIWKPAGASDGFWRRNPTTGRASPYCCLYARPLDWLRVGRFVLNNGTEGAAFLPEDLWQMWITPDLPAAQRAKGSYGLQTRHDVLDRPGQTLQGPFAYMMGHGGQVVYLLPEQDMVVVRFGAEPQLLHSTLYELVD